MKKSSLISILLVLVLAVTLISAVTVSVSADSTPHAGNVKVNDVIVPVADDGYYYVNKQFTYEKKEGATSYFYVPFTDGSTIADITALELSQSANKVANSVPQHNEDDKTTAYYCIVDEYVANNVTTYSKVRVVVYDTVAPVVDNDKLNAWLKTESSGNDWSNDWVPAAKEFVLPLDLLKDKDILQELTSQEAEGDKTVNSTKKLVIKFEFCSPSSYADAREWSSCDSDDEYNVTAIGYWHFRYNIEDLAGNTVTTDSFTRFVRDTTPPTIEFSTSQKKVETTGTAAGKTYSIVTPTISDDTATTTYYYVIYKLIDGEYVAIYNSDDTKIADEYKDYLSGSGKNITLTPGAREIATSTNDKINYIYKVTYYVEDSYGYKFEDTLNILTTQPDATTDPYVIWKWVLIGLSIASAIGIIALIFIKPKKKPIDKQINK